MKKTRMADGLLKGLEQAVKMERGSLVGRERVRTLSRPAPKWSKHEIKHLRTKVFHMSQPVFASLINVKPDIDCLLSFIFRKNLAAYKSVQHHLH